MSTRFSLSLSGTGLQSSHIYNNILTQQVPTGLFRPRIVGHFQRFFKHSKHGPILLIFFLKVPKSTEFSPPQKKAGPPRGPEASADRKHHSVKKTDTKCRERIFASARKLIKYRSEILLILFMNNLCPNILREIFVRKVMSKYALLTTL